MKINFPEKEGFYALEMPQVYSAYELYINDKLYLKVGDTHNYKAQIQNRCTFFAASGETYITIAVKDASGGNYVTADTRQAVFNQYHQSI